MGAYNLTLNIKEDSLSLDNIHLSQTNKLKLQQLLQEFEYHETLKKYGLNCDNKLLLFGHTGCGKTSTARAVAKRLKKKIIILNLGTVIDSRLGQSAKNITEVFQKAARENAVLFLDEFDYIGKARDNDQKDSGEMKRLVNSVIQLIDQLPHSTLLIGATNHQAVIDTALLRRFQLRLEFEKPSQDQLDVYYNSLLQEFPEKFRKLERVYNLSYAEAKDITIRAVKNNIITLEEANKHRNSK